MVVLLGSGDALAEPPRVVLVRPALRGPSIDETISRARAELMAAGFEPVVVEPQAGEDARAAIRRSDPGAIAVIAIVAAADEPEAEVWIDDRLTGKISIRAVQADGDPHRAAANLAIQAVELLRASLLEVSAPSRPKSAPPVPAEAAAFARKGGPEPHHGGFFLEAGVALFVGFDPGSIHVAPTAAVSWLADVGVGPRLRWVGPGAGPALEVPEGSVSWTPWLLGAGALLRREVGDRLALRAGAELALLHVHAEGDLRPPAVSRSGSALDAAVVLGGGAALRLTERVALTLGAEVLVSAPPPVIEVGGREVATVGRPWLLFPLTLEVRP